MKTIEEIITLMKANWSVPAKAFHGNEECPFLLTCSFSERLNSPLKVSPDTPVELIEFWSLAESAELFKDTESGQWGLQVLTPAQAQAETEVQITEREKDFQATDLVVGLFFGDTDLLFVACDKEKEDYGSVYVALPLDHRAEWPCVARDFREFLNTYYEQQGDKYWEY